MKITPPDFLIGAYTSKGSLGTDSPFELPSNNPFYFFFGDGTYIVILNERELKGKWWYNKNMFFIQLENGKGYQFFYYSENAFSEFRLDLLKGRDTYSMRFKKMNE
jgi:hypothetical protein